MGVAAGLEHAAGGVDAVEPMLGVRGEGTGERLQLGGDDVAALVRLVLEDGGLLVAVGLDVSAVRDGRLRYQHLQPRAARRHPRASQEPAPVQAVDSGRAIEFRLRLLRLRPSGSCGGRLRTRTHAPCCYQRKVRRRYARLAARKTARS